MQNESGTSSVKVRMCSLNQAHHQDKQECAILANRSSRFGTGSITEKYFTMNELLLSLIYQEKMVSSLWQATKIN